MMTSVSHILILSFLEYLQTTGSYITNNNISVLSVCKLFNSINIKTKKELILLNY
jgi:hypothetical protein